MIFPGKRLLWILPICMSRLAFSQTTSDRVTNTSDGVLTAIVALGTLTPAKTTSVNSASVQFRVRCKQAVGYRLDASATFAVINTGLPAGGNSISASDIGVGISSIVYASGVDFPRTDTIASGFNYNPASVSASNGLTPFGGMASGRATLADLVSRSVKLLSGPRIDHQANNSNADYYQVTMTFGVLPQYFTPGTFSGVITLTVSDGP